MKWVSGRRIVAARPLMLEMSEWTRRLLAEEIVADTKKAFAQYVDEVVSDTFPLPRR